MSQLVDYDMNSYSDPKLMSLKSFTSDLLTIHALIAAALLCGIMGVIQWRPELSSTAGWILVACQVHWILIQIYANFRHACFEHSKEFYCTYDSYL
jgi:hypothetical protein